MNLFQRSNQSAAFLTIGGFGSGLVFALNAKPEKVAQVLHDPSLYLLSTFLIVFRIKSFLDDHSHFGEKSQDELYSRYVGFIFAVFSWILYGVAATSISNINLSIRVSIAALAISSIWIVVHMVEIALKKTSQSLKENELLLRMKWFWINAGYILCLGGYLGWTKTYSGCKGWPFLALINLVLAYDMWESKSYKGVLQVKFNA